MTREEIKAEIKDAIKIQSLGCLTIFIGGVILPIIVYKVLKFLFLK